MRNKINRILSFLGAFPPEAIKGNVQERKTKADLVLEQISQINRKLGLVESQLESLSKAVEMQRVERVVRERSVEYTPTMMDETIKTQVGNISYSGQLGNLQTSNEETFRNTSPFADAGYRPRGKVSPSVYETFAHFYSPPIRPARETEGVFEIIDLTDQLNPVGTAAWTMSNLVEMDRIVKLLNRKVEGSTGDSIVDHDTIVRDSTKTGD